MPAPTSSHASCCSLGVGPEVLVALHLERSADFVIALLATLKAGAAWLPLDPSLPHERLSFILSDARPALLLTHSSLDVGIRSFRMEALSEQLSSLSEEDLEVTPDGDNLAYVIYTSGSTGRPKGTLLHHRGLCNTVLQGIDAMDLGPRSRVLPYASIGFDASIWRCFPPSSRVDSSSSPLATSSRPACPCTQFLREHAITTANFTPSLLALLEPQGLESLHTLVAARRGPPPGARALAGSPGVASSTPTAPPKSPSAPPSPRRGPSPRLHRPPLPQRPGVCAG